MATKKPMQTPATTPRSTAAAGAMDVWDRVAWICLHILVILVPIAMSNLGPFSANGAPFTYDQFDIVKVFFERGLMLVALGSWIIGVLVRGGRVRWSKVEWLVLAFLVWVVITSALSIHPPTAIFGKYRRFEGLVSFLLYASVFFVSLQLVDRPARLRSIARSLAIGGFLVAAYGAIQVIGTVGIGTARVLQYVSLAGGVAAGGAALWYGSARVQDIETRRALLIGAAIAIVSGVIMYAGIKNNIRLGAADGLPYVALDPVRWGMLPFETNRAFSTFGNPDLLGGYLIFPWAVALGLALTERHRVWRSIYWVFTVLNAFVGLTAYVRGAWIGATVSALCLVLAYVRAKKGSDLRLQPVDRLFIGGTAAIGSAVAVVTSLRPDAVRNVLTRVVSIFQFDQGSALTRFQIWEAAWRAIAERPIRGWGADTFRLLFPMFKPAEYVAAAGYISVADNVHNYPLQLTTGLGIPGFLLLYGLIGWALVSSAPTAFPRGTGASRLLYAGFWAAALGYMVHLMFGLSVTGSTMFLWLAMGVLLSPGAMEHDVRSPSWRAAGVGVVATLVLVGTVLNVRFIAADNHFLKGRVLTSGSGAVAEVERAIALNPYNDMYRLELGAAWQDAFRSYAQQYLQQQGQKDPAIEQAMTDAFGKAEAAYRSTIKFVPNEYDTYVFLANLYNEGATYLNPKYAEEAIKVGELGTKVEPFGPAVRLQLAIAYDTVGRPDDAVRELEYAVELDPQYSQARLALGQIYHSMGRLDDARAQYEAVLARFPDNVQAQQGLAALDASMSGGAGTQ